ncbi:hypothetical protein VNO80_02111 [Phaseolus coccineus]|uniref:Uncharacterized protein n=1 Tax=Phaseolus coccineus TaxID=3886 RepID=A0AAN9RMM3_PHACN
MPPEAVNMDDIEYERFPDRRPVTGRLHASMPALSNVAEEAQNYCCIAASLLRLFTKREDNYVMAFNHIIAGYTRLFKVPMIIAPPQPSTESNQRILEIAQLHNFRS